MVTKDEVIAEVTGTIKSIGEKRQVTNRFGKKLNVAEAQFDSKETGVIALSLWGDDCVKFREGDTVIVKNATVKEFRGVLSLSPAPKSKGGSVELSQ
jgi:ssDNA-binding replication factor A large subunit